MEIVLTIISGIAIAGISSWITVQLSLKRFQTEKWWEMKATAYSNLLGTIHDAKAFSEENLEADYHAKELTDAQDKELRAKSHKASAEIYRAMDVGAFYLSKEAIERLKLYKNHPEPDNPHHSWVVHLEGDFTETNSCLKDMIEIARNDLQINTDSTLTRFLSYLNSCTHKASSKDVS